MFSPFSQFEGEFAIWIADARGDSPASLDGELAPVAFQPCTGTFRVAESARDSFTPGFAPGPSTAGARYRIDIDFAAGAESASAAWGDPNHAALAAGDTGAHGSQLILVARFLSEDNGYWILRRWLYATRSERADSGDELPRTSLQFDAPYMEQFASPGAEGPPALDANPAGRVELRGGAGIAARAYLYDFTSHAFALAAENKDSSGDPRVATIDASATGAGSILFAADDPDPALEWDTGGAPTFYGTFFAGAPSLSRGERSPTLPRLEFWRGARKFGELSAPAGAAKFAARNLITGASPAASEPYFRLHNNFKLAPSGLYAPSWIEG